MGFNLDDFLLPAFHCSLSYLLHAFEVVLYCLICSWSLLAVDAVDISDLAVDFKYLFDLDVQILSLPVRGESAHVELSVAFRASGERLDGLLHS